MNTSDNWLYNKKTKELNSDITSAGSDTAIGISDGWVGYGDNIDYYAFDLAYAANLSFDITSTDDIKFTIWSVTDGTKVKSLQSTTFKKGKKTEIAGVTKNLLLDNAENVQYYFSVESTNAKKGGSATYSVEVNTGNDPFYTNSNDDANNLLYDKKDQRAESLHYICRK